MTKIPDNTEQDSSGYPPDEGPSPVSDEGYPPDADVQQVDGPPFRVLGYNNGTYYYFPARLKQVVGLSAGAHSMANLCQLAPAEYWRNEYGGKGVTPAQLLVAATDDLIQQCSAKGVFEEFECLRGSGIWIDRNRLVINTGPKLYCEGREVDFSMFDGDFAYTASTKRFESRHQPLTNEEAAKFRAICEAPTFTNKLSGSLMAGFCVIAPICATLGYRPHIHITGESESGKSTVTNRIIKPAIGRIAYCADGGTTEPSIRERMGADARPLIYDEAEGESHNDSEIMGAVIRLARKASTGANVDKFGQRPFRAQFCACFSAVNPQIDKTADENRMTFLVLKKNRRPNADKEYEDLLKAIDALMTPDFAERLLARTLSNFWNIHKNIGTFYRAARRVLKQPRLSESMGAMLAGLYSLGRTGVITDDDAEKWIRAQNWEDHTHINIDSDPVKLLQHISSSIVRYIPTQGNTRDLSIGTLIGFAMSGDNVADMTLRNYAIKISEEHVSIGDNSPNLKKLLRGTDWYKRWNRTLLDVAGAEKVSNDYFARGVKMNAVRLPRALFNEEYVSQQQHFEDIPL